MGYGRRKRPGQSAQRLGVGSWLENGNRLEEPLSSPRKRRSVAERIRLLTGLEQRMAGARCTGRAVAAVSVAGTMSGWPARGVTNVCVFLRLLANPLGPW